MNSRPSRAFFERELKRQKEKEQQLGNKKGSEKFGVDLRTKDCEFLMKDAYKDSFRKRFGERVRADKD